MSAHPLAELLENIDRAGQLKRVTAPVDAELEIAEITGRVARDGGPALLFEQVRGVRLPVVTNLLGSRERICLALGVRDIEAAAGRLKDILTGNRASGWLERLRGTGGLAPTGRWEHTPVKSAGCQQVVRLGADVDLGELPALRCWPCETRRAITAGLVYCTDETLPFFCAGLYRFEVTDKTTLAMHWYDHEPLAQFFRQYQQQGHQQQGQPMPVAIVLGGDPQDLVLAGLSHATFSDPHLWQAVRAGKPVETVEGKTIPFSVPANSDVVLEGQIDTTAPPVEIGPAAGPFGQYYPARPARSIQVTAITERVNPIVTAMVTGGPPCEHTVLIDVLSRLTLPLIQTRIPEVVDYHAASGHAPGGVVFVAMRKTFAGESQKVAAALWGSDEFFLSNMIVLVDGDVDVRDHARVMLAVAAHVDPARDVHFHAAGGDGLEAAAGGLRKTGRMVIDATAKLTGSQPSERPGKLATSPEIEQLVQRRWEEYGV